jgi:hypothetical protein
VFIRNPVNKLPEIRIKIAFRLYDCSVSWIFALTVRTFNAKSLSHFNSEIIVNNIE